ncbi:hypothetical protein Emag_004226 [Eimeria magna]
MTPTESWLAPPNTVHPQAPSNTPPTPSPPGWLSMQTQSVPAETLRLSPQPNDWMSMRAATEMPGDEKEWKPKTPPQLVVSIIGQLLKLLPEPSPRGPVSSDTAVHKREESSETFSPHIPLQEPPASVPSSNPAFLSPPSPFSRETVQIKYTQEEAVVRPPSFWPPSGPPATLRISYSEYPSIYIVQSRDFLPSIKVRKSSQPAVHIYTRIPLRVEDQFDSIAKQHAFRPLDRLPGEPSRNEQAEEEGLINPYIRQKQPTIFFHYVAPNTPRSTPAGGDSLAWQPRICIDTTSLWWPSIQCVFANPPNTRAAGGINLWGQSFAEEIASGISVSGPVKPLSLDLPY